MSPSEPFISRPVATTLLTLGIALAGALAFSNLPISLLPQVDFPTISISAQMPGASPDVMAATVATPLERHLAHIADVTEMTSSSAIGTSRITLQFGLNRNIDGAARDVEAAINAARADLPSTLHSNPTYRKVNPADSPIMILALTSHTLTQGQLYDAAETVLAQKLSQLRGVGQVVISGSSLPAVRAEINPYALFKYRIGLEDVRAALSAANADSPKGSIDLRRRRYQLYTNDQASHASEYRNLVIAYRNGAPVRLAQVAAVLDSVEDIRNMGMSEGHPAVLLSISQQPGANIVETVDRVVALLPILEAAMPADIDVEVANNRTITIRAALHDVERALVVSVALVVLVVFLFLRNGRATLIPAIAVPISLLGTFGAMYLLGYSLDNLSMMAVIVATGFVVDDAIVVLENITRHLEAGMPRMQAALLGAQDVGFTVISMSISLIAVFLPILLMAGVIGRLFREFSVTLSVAVLISLLVSLATTPMLCSRFLALPDPSTQGRFFRATERAFETMRCAYGRSLRWGLANRQLVVTLLGAIIVFNLYLFSVIPKGFFPQQDTGRLTGGIVADQAVSFQAMQKKLQQYMEIIKADPTVLTVVGYTGGGSQGGAQTNSGSLNVTLKPKSMRDVSADEFIARLRPKLAQVPGARVLLQSRQDLRIGGRPTNAQYQYTLQADDRSLLYEWGPKLAAALTREPALTDIDSDQQQGGLEIGLVVDRDTAARLQLNPAVIDNTLYDAFGQRNVSTIYGALNQYHVVMEVAPQFWQSPDTLQNIWVSTAGGTVKGTQSTNAVTGTVIAGGKASSASAESLSTDVARNQANNALANSGRGAVSTGSADSTTAETMVPLSVISHYEPTNTPLAVNHQGSFVATTLSFNLAPGASLSDAVEAMRHASEKIGLPATVRGSFQGTARTYQQSQSNEPVLILAAMVAVYIVLGILYESYIHPLTILSTLPSAGTGAVLALLLFKAEFSIIALIGLILLIGIVQKNAIMMIDFSLEGQRHGQSPEEAIYAAALRRFRPIMMTTVAAMFGALPLAFGHGEGAEIRQPLGIAIVGGLFVSQVLTLYTTPVVYLYMDRLGTWCRRAWPRRHPKSPGSEQLGTAL
jgi:multidrug efflux pump